MKPLLLQHASVDTKKKVLLLAEKGTSHLYCYSNSADSDNGGGSKSWLGKIKGMLTREQREDEELTMDSGCEISGTTNLI